MDADERALFKGRIGTLEKKFQKHIKLDEVLKAPCPLSPNKTPKSLPSWVSIGCASEYLNSVTLQDTKDVLDDIDFKEAFHLEEVFLYFPLIPQAKKMTRLRARMKPL